MIPSLLFLSDDELETIHNTALDILETEGMQMPSPRALDILRQGGCSVDDNDIVRFPREIVLDAIKKTPSRDDTVLYARDIKNDFRPNADAPALAAMVEATQVVDLHSRKKRPATIDDLIKMTRLLEVLENVAIASPPVTPQDVPLEVTDWHTWAASLSYTTKHITGPGTGSRCVKDVVKMASLAAGGEDKFLERPFLSFWVLTRPPLQVDSVTLDAMVEASGYGCPLIISSGPILGTTSPVTIVGTCAQAHAEILSCLTLAQLVRPGVPVIYTSFARSMDMRTGNVAMSSPEFAVLKGCMGALGKKLGLPTRMPAMLRDAKILDAQAGFETGMTGLVSALSADIMDGMQFDMDIVVDYADFVFADECMAQLRRVARPIEVNEKTLARDVIASVKHGGNFLKANHTLSNFRKEIWQPRLVERRMWGPWERDGALEIKDKALARARELVEAGTPDTLSAEVIKEIESIAKSAEQY